MERGLALAVAVFSLGGFLYLLKKERKMALQINSIIEKVRAQHTRLESLDAFVEGLFEQIKNNLPGMTAEQKEALDRLEAEVEKSDELIDKAFAENVPEEGGEEGGGEEEGEEEEGGAQVQGQPRRR